MDSIHLLQIEVLGGTAVIVLLIGTLWWWLRRRHKETQNAIEGVRIQISDNTDQDTLHGEKSRAQNKKFQLTVWRQVLESIKSMKRNKNGS